MLFPLLEGLREVETPPPPDTTPEGRKGHALVPQDVWRMEVERLLMICEALWTFLKEQHGYTDEDLFRRVMEIDLRDGRADGRVAATPARRCPHCGRTMTRGRPICIYCGRASVANVFER